MYNPRPLQKICVFGFAFVTAISCGDASASKEHVLYSFGTELDNGQLPVSLVTDGKGVFYGTTTGFDGQVIFKFTLKGRKETVLHRFELDGVDGRDPVGDLTMDQAGNLYGASFVGGENNEGTVFELEADGQEKVLFSFKGGIRGSYPSGGVVFDDGGNLYGPAQYGGKFAKGIVYKITPRGHQTIIHSFSGGSDGDTPTGKLLADNKGNFYGTTAYGGTFNSGVVFKLTPAGKETVLYSFGGGSDGATPDGLTMDQAGNFYGETGQGGTGNAGTVFYLTKMGKKKTLYSFAGGADGFSPFGGIVADQQGNLYGTTYYGGGSSNCQLGCGTVFKLAADGTETVLHAFNGNDGASPYELTADGKGNLIGITESGGDGSSGTIFEVVP